MFLPDVLRVLVGGEAKIWDSQCGPGLNPAESFMMEVWDSVTVTIIQSTHWLKWDGKYMGNVKCGLLLDDTISTIPAYEPLWTWISIFVWPVKLRANGNIIIIINEHIKKRLITGMQCLLSTVQTFLPSLDLSPRHPTHPFLIPSKRTSTSSPLWPPALLPAPPSLTHTKHWSPPSSWSSQLHGPVHRPPKVIFGLRWRLRVG